MSGFRSCQRPMWGDTARVPRPPLFCGKPVIEGRAWCVECLPRMVTRPQMAASTQRTLAGRVDAGTVRGATR